MTEAETLFIMGLLLRDQLQARRHGLLRNLLIVGATSL